MIDLSTDIKTALKGQEGGKLVVKRTQDTTPYLEANEREYNSAASWRPYAGKGNLRKVAEIPNIIVEQWLKEGINIFSPDPAMQRAFRRKLDDHEFRKLRTMPGKVGMRTRHF
jgi:hypothetical protein